MPVSVTFIQGQSLVKLYVHSSPKLKRSHAGKGTQLRSLHHVLRARLCFGENFLGVSNQAPKTMT